MRNNNFSVFCVFILFPIIAIACLLAGLSIGRAAVAAPTSTNVVHHVSPISSSELAGGQFPGTNCLEVSTFTVETRFADWSEELQSYVVSGDAVETTLQFDGYSVGQGAHLTLTGIDYTVNDWVVALVGSSIVELFTYVGVDDSGRPCLQMFSYPGFPG